MGIPSRRRHRAVFALVCIPLSLVLSACSQGSQVPTPTGESSGVTRPVTPQDTSSIPDPLPEHVTAKGVVLATVIIATGNVASAIEQGMASPQEVDLARKAIAEGTVQEWVDAAELEQ